MRPKDHLCATAAEPCATPSPPHHPTLLKTAVRRRKVAHCKQFSILRQLLPAYVRFGVGPEQIAKQPLVGHVYGPWDLEDLTEPLQLRANSAVHAEDLILHDRGHRHAVEAVRKNAPQFYGIPALALVVEPCTR